VDQTILREMRRGEEEGVIDEEVKLA